MHHPMHVVHTRIAGVPFVARPARGRSLQFADRRIKIPLSDSEVRTVL